MGAAILEEASTLDSLVQWPAVPIRLADDKEEVNSLSWSGISRGFLQHHHTLSYIWLYKMFGIYIVNVVMYSSNSNNKFIKLETI